METTAYARTRTATHLLDRLLLSSLVSQLLKVSAQSDLNLELAGPCVVLGVADGCAQSESEVLVCQDFDRRLNP